MNPDGLIPAHRFVQLDVNRGCGNEIFAAHHMSDAHVVVVGHGGQVVKRLAAAAHDDGVLQTAVVEPNLPANSIVQNRFTRFGHFEA